jgi:hypothetical protein
VGFVLGTHVKLKPQFLVARQSRVTKKTLEITLCVVYLLLL